jgi:hypothetical protein
LPLELLDDNGNDKEDGDGESGGAVGDGGCAVGDGGFDDCDDGGGDDGTGTEGSNIVVHIYSSLLLISSNNISLSTVLL